MTIYPSTSSCRTHHIDSNGDPVYGQRFKWVLPFHDPGLAPVENFEGSYHITPVGKPAYDVKFEGLLGTTKVLRLYKKVNFGSILTPKEIGYIRKIGIGVETSKVVSVLFV